MPLDPLLSTSAAAECLGLSPSFLNKLRCTGGGPRYVKLGRRVLYPKADLRVLASNPPPQVHERPGAVSWALK